MILVFLRTFRHNIFYWQIKVSKDGENPAQIPKAPLLKLFGMLVGVAKRFSAV
tara:strand:- start:73 stop:231 length:159 start_codon:yes stop_codon:yes gene_type:complete